MEYQTLYEYHLPAIGISRIILIILFSVLGFGIAYFKKKINTKFSFSGQVYVFVGYLIGGFFGFFALFNLYNLPGVIKERRAFTKMIDSKTYLVAEGETQDFVPYSSKRGKFVKYSVNGVQFEFTDFDPAGAIYHQVAVDSGPITGNGQKVRISYFTLNSNNCILKIEIKE